MIQEAVIQGARQKKACEIVGISPRTIQYWSKEPDRQDMRQGPATAPEHKFTPQERERIIAVATAPGNADLCPGQLVARLADEGVYVASESSFYRVLRQEGLTTYRQPSSPPQTRRRPEASATAPNQVWVWDITYLRSTIDGKFFYLYKILDLFSRKVIAWRIEVKESEDFAIDLFSKAVIKEEAEGRGLIIHSDNGAVMRSGDLGAMLKKLQVFRSFSRPRVSNDNAFAESYFRTMKYRPSYPRRGMDLEKWRIWVESFVDWYNEEHRHSGIGYVTPSQRHEGLDGKILERRKQLYEESRQLNPRRWSGHTRPWARPAQVRLAPDLVNS